MAPPRKTATRLTGLTVAIVAPFTVTGFATAWQEPATHRPAQAAAKRISLLDNRFSPSSSSTSADSVRFVWRGRNSHDVIFTQAPGSHPPACGLQRRGSCSRPLRRRGTYRFVCSIHSEMTGKIRRR